MSRFAMAEPLDPFDGLLKRAQEKLLKGAVRRLTNEQVRAIMVDPRATQTLSRIFGVLPKSVLAIKNRETHADVTADLTPGFPEKRKRVVFSKGPKLDANQARKIYLDTRRYEDIAITYKVHRRTVEGIKRKRFWRYATLGLGEPPEQEWKRERRELERTRKVRIRSAKARTKRKERNE